MEFEHSKFGKLEFENSEYENFEFENFEFENLEFGIWNLEFENSEFENLEFENGKSYLYLLVWVHIANILHLQVLFFGYVHLHWNLKFMCAHS